jgi:serine/threonine protein phosphatase PrpC
MVEDPQILSTILRFQSIDTAARTLIQLANDAGGVDNITAVLCRVEAA